MTQDPYSVSFNRSLKSFKDGKLQRGLLKKLITSFALLKSNLSTGSSVT